ncbi:MAG: glycosyltransferase family 4 protein [Baekduia sp.]
MTNERLVHWHAGRHVHPVYREQLHAVPPGWRYGWSDTAFGDATAPTKKVTLDTAGTARAIEFGEAAALRMLSAAGYVHVTRANPPAGTALLHSAERLIWRSPLPYVVDLEHVDLFVIYQRAAYRRPWTVPLLERLLMDDRLRFLLPWSEAAKDSLLALVSARAAATLAPKLRTVYPAVRPRTDRPRERSGGPLRLLFVGTKFYEKGGVDAILAVRAARAAGVDAELDIVTYAPPEWAARIDTEPGVRLRRPGGQDVVRDLYAEADALLFPSHMDTYGVVVGEAMSYGVPVLAPDHLALRELVEHRGSGLLFGAENMLYGEDTRCAFAHTLPPPRRYLEALRMPTPSYVEGIAAAIAELAADPELLATCAEGALRSVTTGRLSIGRRRDALTEIYAAAA